MLDLISAASGKSHLNVYSPRGRRLGPFGLPGYPSARKASGPHGMFVVYEGMNEYIAIRDNCGLSIRAITIFLRGSENLGNSSLIAEA